MAKDEKRAQLAAIHIAQKALGLSSDDATALKLSVTAVASSADMTALQRRQYLAHLSDLQARQRGDRPAKKPFTQADKINWLWTKLHAAGAIQDPSEAALMAFVGRTTGMSVAHLKFLPVREGITVTEALKSWLNRTPTVNRKAPNDR